MSEADVAPSVVTLDDAFRTHYRTVLRYVHRRVYDLHLAEEIASQCFVIAWTRLVPRDITRAWLLKTASHLIGDAIRRRDREKRLIQSLTTLDTNTDSTPSDTLLGNALASLAPRDRDILLLRYWDDLNTDEIAEILGTTVTATWKRLSRAQTRLRVLLDPKPSPFPQGEMQLAMDR